MKSIVPVVMAGILGIYGLIIAVIISTGINPTSKPYYFFDGYAHLASGLSCGLAGLGAGKYPIFSFFCVEERIANLELRFFFLFSRRRHYLLPLFDAVYSIQNVSCVQNNTTDAW